MNKKKQAYFEGFYFKHQSDKMTIAFIPSIHINDDETYALIQVIANNFTSSYRFDLYDALIVDTTIMIEKNVFSKEGIYIDLKNDDFHIKGRLFYDNVISPNNDIMGIFKYLPKMECSHGVISITHKLRGSLLINNQEIDFNDGYGYIEKDSGRSFPSRYLWTQCLFQNISVMMSVANIPYLGMHFNGCISIILYKGKQYRLATYKGAKIISFKKDEVILKQGKYKLKAKLIKYDAQILKAPQNGQMNRDIMESINCHVYYEFSKDNHIVFSFVSNQASFEYSNHNKETIAIK